MSNSVDWSKAPEGTEFFCRLEFYKLVDGWPYYHNGISWEQSSFSFQERSSNPCYQQRPAPQENATESRLQKAVQSIADDMRESVMQKVPVKCEISLCDKTKTSDTSVSIANLLNAQVSIANARKSSEFSEHNAELADQAEAILQAIIGNLKAERIPADASFHLANAQNELNACAKLLEGDKALAGAVFCIGEKLAGIRKGEL